jgi:hypothetical protein
MFCKDKSVKPDRQNQAESGATDSTQQQATEKSNPRQRFRMKQFLQSQGKTPA